MNVFLKKKLSYFFFGVAYCYCSANDLKLSPEVNSGNGHVDFNLSKGFKANVNVEMKISDSNKLENGLWSQLNIYNKAENTDRSIYIIVKTNQNQSEKIDKLINVVNYRVSKGEKIPEILVIDSTYKESASVRK
jgi:predicted transcriptional regulator of viral defense system